MTGLQPVAFAAWLPRHRRFCLTASIYNFCPTVQMLFYKRNGKEIGPFAEWNAALRSPQVNINPLIANLHLNKLMNLQINRRVAQTKIIIPENAASHQKNPIQ